MSASQEPSSKRVRPLAKVSSLVNLMSPSKGGAVRRFGQTIQVNVAPQRCHGRNTNTVMTCNPLVLQSMSLRSDNKSPGMSLKAGSRAAAPTPSKRRNSTLWSETLDVHQKSTFSAKEIKRQEVPPVFLFQRSSIPDC